MPFAPGTESYSVQLGREYNVIQSDLRGLKDVARMRAHSAGTLYQIELAKVMNTEAGLATQRDMNEYNHKVMLHRAALNRARQARANAAQTTRTQAAACKSCFTVHSGECY